MLRYTNSLKCIANRCSKSMNERLPAIHHLAIGDLSDVVEADVDVLAGVVCGTD